MAFVRPPFVAKGATRQRLRGVCTSCRARNGQRPRMTTTGGRTATGTSVPHVAPQAAAWGGHTINMDERVRRCRYGDTGAYCRPLHSPPKSRSLFVRAAAFSVCSTHTGAKCGVWCGTLSRPPPNPLFTFGVVRSGDDSSYWESSETIPCAPLPPPVRCAAVCVSLCAIQHIALSGAVYVTLSRSTGAFAATDCAQGRFQNVDTAFEGVILGFRDGGLGRRRRCWCCYWQWQWQWQWQ